MTIDFGDNATNVFLNIIALIGTIVTAFLALRAGNKASGAEKISLITDVKTDALAKSVDGILTARVDVAEKLGHAEGHAAGLREGNGGDTKQVEVVNAEPIPVKVDPASESGG